MKRLLSCLLLVFALLCLVACGAINGGQNGGQNEVPCVSCKDSDYDHKCDVCKNSVSSCNDGNGDHLCDTCESVLNDCKDSNEDSKCDVCQKVLHDCLDVTHDHLCDICNDTISDCIDGNRNHECDVCKKVLGVCEDKNNDHECDFCKGVASKYVDTNADRLCDICGEAHPTCIDDDRNHRCDICEIIVSPCEDKNSNHKCDYSENADGGCNVFFGAHEDKDLNHACDYCEAEDDEFGPCADADENHKCDYGCDKKFGIHADADMDHKCDYCKQGEFGLHADANDDNDHICDYCKSEELFEKCVNKNADHLCDVCGEVCSVCIDYDSDDMCNVCGVFMGICTFHVDKNHNQKCDKCGEEVPCEHELDQSGFCYWCDYFTCVNHVDRDHNLVCDNDGCEVAVPCTKHADADQNAQCDWCEADYSCSLEKHEDLDQDGICDECMCTVENFDFPWSDGTLTFEMTDHSNGQELPSGCRNWMAGETSANTSLTQLAAAERNQAALEATRLTIQYKYLPDNDSEYGWSRNIYRINTNQAQGIYSDMYCNFVYDLIGASLLGCFANLKTSKADNYFEFAGNDDYGEVIGDSNGYMYEYMTSLSIMEDRMYLLASDYFIDLIRAYYCVPVNIAMLDELAEKDILKLGRANTVTDFADAVMNHKWTYDLLLKYCANYEGSSVDSATKGFAIAEHSLSAAGLLYTSSVRFFTDERKEVGNSFVPNGENSPYHYSESNQKFMDLAVALENMVTSAGVVRFTKSYSTNLLHIRDQFTNHRVLFGGVILLGSLEYQDYQDMKTGDGEGFLVVPVPLYTDYNEETGDVYNTQIHNVGRIGAISIKTRKFAECSAFLNFQSTRSRVVKESYFSYELLYSVVGGVDKEIYEANKKMLNLMRDSVHSGFEKAYEDASALLNSHETVPTPDGNKRFSDLKWHDILDKAHYADSNGIRSYYDCLKGAKEKYMGVLFNFVREYIG